MVALLSLASGALGRPGLHEGRHHHARPATSYSYFSMALPSAHHHAPAAPIYVAHDAQGLHQDDDEHGELYHEEPVIDVSAV